MFDLNEFKKKAVLAIGEAGRQIRKYAPETFSPEKKFANSVVSAVALIIIADRKVETEEVTQGIEFIRSLDVIQELGLEAEAIEMFDHIIENVMTHIDNEPKWIIETSKVIANISLISADASQVAMITDILNHIAGSDGNVDESEIIMRDKIIAALNKS